MTDVEAAAHEALHEAIRAVIELDDHAGVDAADLLLTDWVVAYACVRASTDGSAAYGLCVPHGTIQSYRALGLLDLAGHQLRTGGWEDDDD